MKLEIFVITKIIFVYYKDYLCNYKLFGVVKLASGNKYTYELMS